MTTAISAPGKVLLAGGYLVLDRAYTGLVFGLNARIHIVVQDSKAVSDDTFSEIVVRSPQFRDAVWTYNIYQAAEDSGIQVVQQKGTSTRELSRNPFVETTLSYVLTYILSVTNTHARSACISILADSDYYSQPGSLAQSKSSDRFLDFGVRLQDAHKTGLGSSAALVTALTGAILSHYLTESQFSLSSEEGRIRLHNLAQAAHCAAQGKVGSGFDVAAAVYGTCIYRRFSPSLLSNLGEPGSTGFASNLRQSVEDSNLNARWDTEVTKGGVAIPKGMALVMCDVDCGSQTVGMVKKVLEWRTQNPDDAVSLWHQLQLENEHLAKILLEGSPIELGKIFEKIRTHIRDMGSRSGVPIEPEEQTALLDAVTTKVEGVYGGVVPGAGGYDAVVLLVKDDEDTLSKLHLFLASWSASSSSNVRLLDVKGEMDGVRREGAEIYEKWF